MALVAAAPPTLRGDEPHVWEGPPAYGDGSDLRRPPGSRGDDDSRALHTQSCSVGQPMEPYPWLAVRAVLRSDGVTIQPLRPQSKNTICIAADA